MAMIMPEAVQATAVAPASSPASAPASAPSPAPVNEGLQKAGRAALVNASGAKPVQLDVIPYQGETNEGYSALAALSSGAEEINDDTPELPQIRADAVMSRLTFDLSNPNHPWNLARMASNVYRYRKGGNAFDPSAGSIIDSTDRGGAVAGKRVKLKSGLEVTSFEGPGGEGGIDMYSDNGKFPAMLPGRVKEIGWQYDPSTGRGYGNYVVIEHRDPKTGDVFDGLYGHLGKARGQGIYVKKGQYVNAGDYIGEQGSTGSVRSADGTIASFDLLKKDGGKAIYKRADGLRREIADAIGKGYLLGGFRETAPSPQAGNNVTRFAEFLAYLESSQKPGQVNRKTNATGYFQFIPGTVKMGENYGIRNFRQRILSNDMQEATSALMEFIKIHHPRAHALILKGNYDAAFPLIKGTWPSVPGGSQSRPERVAEAREFLS